MRKIIENFSHHLDDYECMWNGIEDIYMNITGESLPDQFFLEKKWILYYFRKSVQCYGIDIKKITS